MAADKPVVAIMQFSIAPGVDTLLAGSLSELVAHEMEAQGSFTVLSQRDIAAMMQHAGDTQALDTQELDMVAPLGAFLGAQYVFSGSIGVVGNVYSVSAKLVDAGLAKIVWRHTVQHKGDAGGLVKIVKNMVRACLKAQGVETETAPKISLKEMAAESSQKLNIAVMDIIIKEGIHAQAGQALTDLVTSEIAKIEKYDVINRDDIRVMLEHMANKQLLDCDDTRCLAVIGGALGVDYLFAGNVGKVGNIFIINVKVIDINKAKVLSRFTREYTGDEAGLVSEMKLAVDKVFDEGRLFRQKMVRWGVLSASLVSAGAGGYFTWAGQTRYTHEYSDAVGHDNALAFKNEIQDLDLYRNISLSVTGVLSSAAWYLFRKK